VVVSDLHNAANPFIRYEVGDIGTMWPDEPCACGRPFPRIASVEGRIQEVVQTPGGPITMVWFSILLKDYPWIDGFQVVQHRLDQLTLRLLTKRELTADLVDPLSVALLERVGNMRIDYERVDKLSRRPSGKAQLLISNL
jgi:phenylacetate-CoA ligase